MRLASSSTTQAKGMAAAIADATGVPTFDNP